MVLDGMHVGILAAEGVEDLEFWVTVMRLREAGARVTSIGLAPGTVQGKNGLAVGVDAGVRDVDAAALDGLVVPGGWMPDKLRRSPAILDLVRAVHAAGRPIGIICHGGLIAISAGIVAGTTSSTPEPRGWTSPPSGTARWSGAGWWTTSPRSAGSSWPPWPPAAARSRTSIPPVDPTGRSRAQSDVDPGAPTSAAPRPIRHRPGPRARPALRIRDRLVYMTSVRRCTLAGRE
jgi:protease I